MNKQNICNICGANYEYKDGRWRCPACGAYKPEEISNEEETLLYTAAQTLRMGNFDGAEELYRDIVMQYPKNSRGYWGLVLAKYGIKYERDYDGKMLPSCYAASYESILSDENYKRALQYADRDNRTYYEQQARRIEDIRREWVEKAEKEEAYDIFLSYKDSDKENGIERTEDSRDAYELYSKLKEKGYRVFFSRESLAGKEGKKFEPYIFNALNTAQVMVVYGTKPAYIESTWVKNEWMRYYKRMRAGQKQEGSLLLAYRGLHPSDLPKPFCELQGFDLGKITVGFGDLEARIESLLSAARMQQKIKRKSVKNRGGRSAEQIRRLDTVAVGKVGAVAPRGNRERIAMRTIGGKSVKLSVSAEKNLSLAESYLERGQYTEAQERFDDILQSSPRNGRALVGKLLALAEAPNLATLEKNGFRSDVDAALVEKVLSNADKESAESILRALCLQASNSFGLGNVAQAKLIVSLVRDYENTSVEKLRAELYERGLQLIATDEESAKYFLDLHLSFVEDKEYVEKLRMVTRTAISHGAFAFAEYSVDKLKNADPYSYATHIAVLAIEFKASDVADILRCIERDKAYYKIENVLTELDAESAAQWLQACFSEISVLLQGGAYVGALRWIEICGKYQFKGRKEQLEALLSICQNNASMRSAECFDAVLTFVADGNVSIYSEKARAFADAALKSKEFDAAKLFYGKVLSVTPDSIAAAKGKFFAVIRCAYEKDLPLALVNLNDWTSFEEVLIVQTDNADDLKWIEKLAAACIEHIQKAGMRFDKAIFEVFERLLSYIPEESDRVLLRLLQEIAQLCLQNSLFSQAQKYYEMLISENAEDSGAYWGLLQAKLKCRNEDDLIRNSEPIGQLSEFENAQYCAANNRAVLNHYLDVREKQSKHIKANKKRKQFIKIGSIALSAIIVVVGALVGWLSYFNSENKLFYRAVDGGYAVAAGKFYQTEPVLCIPAEYDGRPIVAIADNAFSGHEEIQTVILPASVEWIGASAFENCIALETVSFATENTMRANAPQTALREVGDRAFLGCIKLNAFELPFGIEQIGAYALAQTDLREVTVPNTVSYIGASAFDGCANLQSIVVGDRQEIPSDWAENWQEGCAAEVEYRLRVLFDHNDATSGNATRDKYVTFGEMFEFPVPARKGYVFDGWYRGQTRLTDGQGKSLTGWQFEDGGTATATWAPNTNQLVFHANGGNGAMSAQEIATDASVALVSNTFERKGYTFAGWAESATGKVVYQDGAIYKMGAESSYKLFAVWSANQNEITFDGNGATSGNMTAQTMKTDSSASLKSNAFARTGYEFVGWATAADGNVVYKDGASYTMGAESRYTLYAVWETTNYSIKYNLNNGMADGNPISYTIESADIVLQPPTRKGYRFTGWTGTGLDEATLSVTISLGSTGNREYTANWEANSNKVTFHANGGTGEMAAQTIKTDMTAALVPNTFQRTGYSFAGWATQENGDVSYRNEDNYTMGAESSYALYAVWSAIEYNIHYTLAGGSAEGNPLKYTIESETIRLNAPERDGYTFTGWTGTGLSDAALSVSIANGSTGEREYTATWQANINHIVFHANGGDGEMDVQEIATDASAPLSACAFTRPGYSFTGWALDELGGVTYQNGAEYVMGTGAEYHLYAVWTANLNILHFDGNGANSGEMGDMTAYTDENTPLPDNLFVKTGFSFIGWATERGGGVVYENGANYAMGAQAEYTLYAVWQINQYTITIVSNGGTEIAPITQDYNTLVSAPSISRTGYAFVEWYADSAFETVFSFATMPAQNVTVYAKWQMSNLGGELTGIRTADELMAISQNLAGKYYLENDIDMSGYEWIPVGTESQPFTGSFDGRGKKISALTIRKTYKYVGLFGRSDGIIKNIGDLKCNYSIPYERYSYTPSTYVGGCVGYGGVENCNASGVISVSAGIYVGGVTGYGNASRCTSLAKINVYSVDAYNNSFCMVYVGGIAGNGIKLSSCYSGGSISLSNKVSGGSGMIGSTSNLRLGKIAGEAQQIENCYSTLVGSVVNASVFLPNFSYLVGSLSSGAKNCYGSIKADGRGTIENCADSSDPNLQSRQYMVETMGWDESIWCFGYGLPVFYGDDYIRVIYENCAGVNNDSNPSGYKIGSSGFELKIPYRTGYTFDGWYLEDTFKTKIKKVSDISEPLTIYAKWIPNTYEITLNPVGGILDTDSFTMTYDADYQIAVPTLEGYAFEGWYNGTGLTAIAYTDAEGRSLAPWTGTEGITLYAKWRQIKFTVSLDLAGGTTETDTDEAIIWQGEEYTLPVPARENYTFGGWYTALGGGGDRLTDEAGTGLAPWNSETDMTAYAYWLGTDGIAYTLEDDTYSVTGLTNTELTEISIPEYFDGKPVTKISANAFAQAASATKIVIPASIQTIGKGALAGCTSLQSLTIPYVGGSRDGEGAAALLGYLFSDTQQIGCALVYQYYSEYDMSAAYIPNSLTHVIVTDAATIGYGAFSSLTSLQTVEITAQTLSPRVFYDCSSLASVQLHEGITAIDPYAFARCAALQTIVIPSSVQTIGRYVFDECAALTSMTLPFIGANAQASGAEGVLGYLFGNLSSADMVSVNQSNLSAYFPARLNNITITNATQIASNALRGLTMLKTVQWNDEITSIGSYALYGCTGISINSLPTALQTIGDYAFYNVKISVLELPVGVTALGANSFYGTSLRTLMLPADAVVSLGNNALGNPHSALKIYVVDSLVSRYKSEWSEYSARIYSFNCIRDNGMAIEGSTLLQYFGNETNIVLPSNITSIGAYTFAGTNVQSVLVPGSIRTISANAFSGCESLSSVRMLSGVRSISANAFSGASGLTEVIIPNSVTIIEEYAFQNCVSLQEIVVPNSVTSIGQGAFRGCNALTKMTLPFVGRSREATAYTAVFGYIFGYTPTAYAEYSSQLVGALPSNKYRTSLSESYINTNVKIVSGAIWQYSCYNKSGQYGRYWVAGTGGFAGHYANSYGYLLQSYHYYIPSSLRELVITDASKISDAAFNGCTMLTSITLNEGITDVGEYVFYDCDGLTEMTIPESVTSVGQYAFSGCSTLQIVQIMRGDVVSFTSLGSNAFDGTRATLNIIVPDDAYESYCSAENWTTYASKIKSSSMVQDGFIIEDSTLLHYIGSAETVTIPTGVTAIGDYAFAYNAAVKHVVMGEGVLTIGQYAFYRCDGLQSVMIYGGQSVGDYAFANNIALQTVTLGNVQSIGAYAFYQCGALQSVTYSDGLQSIGNYAFADCAKLSTINSQSPFTFELGKGLLAIGEYAFRGCELVKTIHVGDSVTSIGEGAFNGCNAVTSIQLPFVGTDNTSTTGYTQVFGYIFGYKRSAEAGLTEQVSGYYYYIPATLTEVVITSETVLAENAFIGCAQIISITLNAVTSIGDYAFYNCDGLTTLTIQTGSVPTLSANAFNGGKVVTVQVPTELVEAYSSDEIWKKHSIVAIS